MLLVDDILAVPHRCLFWLFREIHNATQQELDDEARQITNELSENYMMLDTEEITEKEFEAREKILVDRLEKINKIREREENCDEDEEVGDDASKSAFLLE